MSEPPPIELIVPLPPLRKVIIKKPKYETNIKIESINGIKTIRVYLIYFLQKSSSMLLYYLILETKLNDEFISITDGLVKILN